MKALSSREMVQAALAVVHTRSVAESMLLLGAVEVLFVDLREGSELRAEGLIPGAFHAPRGVLEFWADAESEWHKPEFSRPGVSLLLYCAVGWRSALAAQTLQQMGLPRVSHLGGGFRAWQAAGGPVQVKE